MNTETPETNMRTFTEFLNDIVRFVDGRLQEDKTDEPDNVCAVNSSSELA